MLPLVSVNGLITPANDAKVSVFDRGFTLGDGVFETIKVAQGEPWYLNRHLKRMEENAEALGISYPETVRDWTLALLANAVDNGINDGALRITLTRGESRFTGLRMPASAGSATVIVVLYDSPNHDPDLYENGISVTFAPLQRNELSPVSAIKTLSYAESIYAFNKAQRSGFDDCILLDRNNFLSEGTASNVFICTNDVVMTPDKNRGILPGITRAEVLRVAAELGYETSEKELNHEELLNAEEAFLTSSLRGIVPIVKVQDSRIGHGVPGKITKKLIEAYNNRPDRV